MNKIKAVLDREPISSDLIQSKQDFGKVLSGAKVSGPGFWKTSWFYGVVGTASIVLTVTVISLDSISQATPNSGVPNENDQVLGNQSESEPTNEMIAHDESTLDQVESSMFSEASDKSKEPIITVPLGHSNKKVEEEEVAEEPVAQEVPKRIESEVDEDVKPVYNSMFPHFGDVYTNEITVDQLCGSKLLCNDEWAVLSFKVQFYKGSKSIEQHIKGNKIPYDFCELFPESGSFPLFVTNIMAENRSTGKVTQLTSMNLKATN